MESAEFALREAFSHRKELGNAHCPANINQFGDANVTIPCSVPRGLLDSKERLKHSVFNSAAFSAPIRLWRLFSLLPIFFRE